MDNFQKQIFSIGMEQGFQREEVQSLINTVDPQYIYEVLNKYGVSMLGILIVIAESNLQVGFSVEPTLGDGNCFMSTLVNPGIFMYTIVQFVNPGVSREINSIRPLVESLGIHILLK